MPIRCYGLKWSYDAGMTGRLLRGPAVRFHEMRGIYTLYKREGSLVYVGRSGKGKSSGIGGRVYAHKIEDKWDFDTYSWFGLLPVNDDGAIIFDAETMDSEQLTNNLEALIIYLLDPPWNGNGGTYKKIPRYRQISV